MIDWETIMPIQAIEEECYININGNVTVGFSVMLPDLYTLTVDVANDIHNKFINVLKLLPTGAIFHKQDIFFTDTYTGPETNNFNYIENEDKNLFEGREILNHYCNIYITFKLNKATSKNSYLKPLDYIFKSPYKSLEKDIKELDVYINTIFNSLNSLPRIKVIKMNNKDLLLNLSNYLNLELDNDSYKDVPLSSLELEKGYFKVANKYVNVISVLSEGEQLDVAKTIKLQPSKAFNSSIEMNTNINLPTSLLFGVGLGLPIPHILNVFIEIKDNFELSNKLEIESRKLNFLVAMKNSSALTKQEDISLYQNNIEKFNYQACYTGINVILFNENLTQLNNNCQQVLASFININNTKSYIENFENGNLFLSSCPGNVEVNKRKFISTIEQSCSYITKETMYHDDLKGHIFADRFGKPTVIDMWDNKLLINRNMIIIGGSGTGKSFNINNYINTILKTNGHVVLIDIGGSYKNNVRVNKGKYISAEDLSKFKLNFFLGLKDEFGKYEFEQEQKEENDEFSNIDFIVSVLSFMWKKEKEILPIEEAIIKKLVLAFFENIKQKKELPTLLIFYNFIDGYSKKFKKESKLKNKFDFVEFKTLLEIYAIGKYAKIFNTTESIDILNDKYVVFELEEIKDDKQLFTIMVMLIINLIVEKIKRLKGVKKVLGIDEALNFLKDKKMGSYIGYLYTTIRKKEGQVFIAAQDINFLKVAPQEIMTSITSNTASYILLDHSNYKSSYPDLQNILSLTDNDIRILDSITNGENYREFFLKMGNLSRIFRTEVSEFAQNVYTSKQKDTEEIERLFEKHRNIITAIKQLIENKHLKL